MTGMDTNKTAQTRIQTVLDSVLPGIKYAEIARQAEMDRMLMYALIAGRAKMTPDRAAKLAAVITDYGKRVRLVTPDELMETDERRG